jgi:hypothetical protein
VIARAAIDGGVDVVCSEPTSVAVSLRADCGPDASDGKAIEFD